MQEKYHLLNSSVFSKQKKYFIENLTYSILSQNNIKNMSTDERKELDYLINLVSNDRKQQYLLDLIEEYDYKEEEEDLGAIIYIRNNSVADTKNESNLISELLDKDFYTTLGTLLREDNREQERFLLNIIDHLFNNGLFYNADKIISDFLFPNKETFKDALSDSNKKVVFAKVIDAFDGDEMPNKYKHSKEIFEIFEIDYTKSKKNLMQIFDIFNSEKNTLKLSEFLDSLNIIKEDIQNNSEYPYAEFKKTIYRKSKTGSHAKIFELYRK